MNFEDINESYEDIYNQSVDHPLQTFEWGQFRKKTGVGIIRRGVVEKNLPAGRQGKIINPYQMSIHKTPSFPYLIGYIPKSNLPSEELLNELKSIGKQEGISFIQLEPNVAIGNWKFEIDNSGLRGAFHPLFTKYTFILDLTKTEEELLGNMHQKTRYNIRLSQKKGVRVEIDNSDEAFGQYLKLTKATTKRQKFYAHDEKYHKLMWETLKSPSPSSPLPSRERIKERGNLEAHLLIAKYKGKTLTAWIIFTFKDTLYYPYGASSDEHREVMASHLTMWEAIRFGKSLGLNKFDMWGAANVANPKTNDSYYGFHRFKEGFGGALTEFVGSYDLIINPLNYRLLTVADKIRWAYLRTKRR